MKNDWMAYDYNQNLQIEKHYQQCLNGVKNFCDQQIILDELNSNKDIKICYVSGFLDDPSTWVEENPLTNQIRPLKRLMISQDFEEVDHIPDMQI